METNYNVLRMDIKGPCVLVDTDEPELASLPEWKAEKLLGACRDYKRIRLLNAHPGMLGGL